MKKIFTILMLAVAVSTGAQTILDGGTPSLGKYVAASVSLSNGADLKMSNYFSFEAGVTKQNLAVGLILGRSSFAPATDELDAWFVEPKAAFTLIERGIVKGYVLFGAGAMSLVDKPMWFVEYGGGCTMSRGNNDLSLQMSNWAGTNYVSIGYARNF